MVVSNRKLAFGTLALGAANVIRIGIQLVMLPLMAHLLGPEEYGLYSLAMPIVMFVMTLADGGLGTSLSRESETNAEVWSSAFWALLISGLVLAVAVSSASFLLGALAHQPRLPYIVMALTPCLLLFVLGVPSNARLVRRGRLDISAIGDVVANLAGAGCAIALALRQAGAWSLVAQTLTIYMVRAIVANAAAPMRPKLHLSYRGLKSHLVLGGTLIGGKLIETGDRSIENSLMGRNFGAGLLGSFSLAVQIPAFLCGTVSNALWASLYAKTLHSTDNEEMRRTFKVMIRIMVLTLFPLAALIVATGGALVQFLLGARWITAAPLLKAFLVSTTILAVGYFGQSILYARGKGFIQFRISTELATARIALVAVTPVIGISAMAAGIVIASIYASLRSLVTICREIEMSLGSAFGQMVRPAASATVAGLLCWFVADRLPSSPIGVSIGLAIGSLAYIATLFVLEGEALFQDFKRIRSLLRPNV